MQTLAAASGQEPTQLHKTLALGNGSMLLKKTKIELKIEELSLPLNLEDSTISHHLLLQ
jgi:DNA-binding transcriptional ArsR family regulator